MGYCYDLFIGDLVCIKSRSGEDSSSGWIATDADPGTILEVIEIDHPFELFNYKARCYDYVVYWSKAEKTEVIPDILLEKYTEWLRRLNEK